MNVLELKDVVKQYHNHTAVNGVSFAVPEGTIFGLLGPNGAGKTSSIRIITSITRADKGQVFFRGEPLHPRHAQEIGYMPEERGLYKKMKVGEEILYLAQLKGMTKAKAQQALEYWLEKFQIKDWLNKKVEELSKGMQQKIQFICTVIHQPKLLILDEPFSGLDPVNTNLIRDEIDALHRSGTTILFSTHRMEQVEQICQNMVLINKGKNVLEGSVKGVKERYKDNLFRVEYQGSIIYPLPPFALLRHEAPGVLEVKLTDETAGTSNDLLRWLLNNGVQIQLFQEILPTLNEIFIKTVGGQSHE